MKVTVKLPFDQKKFRLSLSNNDKSVMGMLGGLEGYWEPHIMNLMKKIININSVCIDLGANIGIISLMLGYLASKGKVYSFEPSHTNYNFLVSNIKENNIGNIETIKMGVLDHNSQMGFSYVNEGGAWSHVSKNNADNKEVIQCVRLDDWLSAKKIQNVDLIKLDVEGSEVRALKGMLHTLESIRPNLIIELNEHTLVNHFNDKPIELYEILKEIYPNIFLIQGNGQLIKIASFNHLETIMRNNQWVFVDLYCTNKPLN